MGNFSKLYLLGFLGLALSAHSTESGGHSEAETHAASSDSFESLASSSVSELPALEAIEERITAIYEKNIDSLLARSKELSPYEQNTHLSAEEFFMGLNCGPSSQALRELLEKHGIAAREFQTNHHVYLIVRAIDKQGKEVDVVVDPTYRQSFGLRKRHEHTSVGEKWNQYENLAEFRKHKMPQLLVVPLSKLKQTVEGFPMPPDWIEGPKIFGRFGFSPVPTFEEWYLIPKDNR